MNGKENLSLTELSEKIFQANINSDKKNQKLKLAIDRIKKKYEPRTEFNRWKQSEAGQSWKRRKYREQQNCCSICDRVIELKGSHIDHIKPISKYPHLALKTSNLQITCWQCNTQKSDR